MDWHNVQTIKAHTYTCGYCGKVVASDRGYAVQGTSGIGVYICPFCRKPSWLASGEQVPGVAPGTEVAHLPSDIAALYKEARNSIAVSAYTAAVLTCRKLLMNIAVAQKAAPGLKFIEYVDYLAANGFIPPNGRGWVDHIRTKGNEAAHEIIVMNKADADDLLTFTEMLLKFIFEFPKRVPQPAPSGAT